MARWSKLVTPRAVTFSVANRLFAMTGAARAMLLVVGLAACGERLSAAAKLGDVSQAHPPASVQRSPTPSATAARLARGLEADAAVVLPIPARSQDPASPASGWCGETAIQEGLLHAGMWASQRVINRAGKPKHPDLYSTDIPVALSGLGLRYGFYPARKKGFEAFAAWMKKTIDAGDPVLAGAKILPTRHPEWGLDHFVLVVGHGSKGLLVNTTWGHRAWVGDTTSAGLSFRNVAYGIRLRGLALPPQAKPARLSVVEESSDTVTLRIACEGLTTGASYRVERTHSASDKRPLWSEVAVAAGGRVEKELAIEADRVSRFYCVPLSGGAS